MTQALAERYMGWLLALGAVALAAALIFALNEAGAHVEPDVIVIDPSAACQEDEAYWWVANDTRGCVNVEEIVP